MKTKILVLGSSGMLGHQVTHYLLKFKEYDVVDISFRKKFREETIILDVTDRDLLVSTITQLKPKYIINNIGALINSANGNTVNAIYLNACLPHYLKDAATTINAKLVHISTDCVFSGKKGKYIETDERDGNDIYGKTKILGEVIDDTHVTLRTSIIGPELKANGEGLFHWFMKQTGSVHGFTKAIWSGVTTWELAKAVKWAIEKDITGLYHVTNGQPVDKYTLLKLFQKYTGKEIEIIPVDGKEVDKSFVDTRQEIDYDIPDYDTMIGEMVDQIKRNPIRYAQYMKQIHA
jgi:dTDP-4-dehydrorhamnose reductase